MRIPFSAQKRISSTSTLYQVLTRDHQKVWLESAPEKAATMVALATETPDADIAFRNPPPIIYTDKTLKTSLATSDLIVLPDAIKMRFPKQDRSSIDVVFTTKTFVTIGNRQIARISVDALHDSMSAIGGTMELEPIKPIRIHIRDIWVATTDDKARTAFWLIQRPGC